MDVSVQCKEVGASISTQLSESDLCVDKVSLKVSAAGGRRTREKIESRGGIRDHMHNFLFFH